MGHAPSNFCRALSEEMDPERLQRKFLLALLELQNVERGSIWVKRDNGYLCLEAVGAESELVKGVTIGADRPSIAGWVIEHGEMTIAEPGKDVRHFKEMEKDLLVKSRLILCFPLFLKNREVYGAVELIDTNACGNRFHLAREYLDLLQELVDIGSLAISHSLIYSRQVNENRRLRKVIDAIRHEESIIGRSLAFLKASKMAADYARTDFPVLITGESGTGKEIIAREIHRQSHRADRPFLVQNCSAIPDTLLESELFGYRKGAFTGANKDKVGLFEAAHQGTVFLDEIGDMPVQLQARILRILQNNEVKPLGGTEIRTVDVRIISATNKDLHESIGNGTFREDLYYRLNVLPIHIPPLRERREDIPLLLDHFIRRESIRMGIPVKKLSPEATGFLVDYPWKGNIRELENFVKRVVAVSEEDHISLSDLSMYFSEATDTPLGDFEASERGHHGGGGSGKGSQTVGHPEFEGYTWEELEKTYVMYLLEKNKWHITRAAKQAGVNRSTFDSRMKKLGISK